MTALYELVPVGVRVPPAIGAVDSMRYQPVTATAPARRGSSELLFVKVRYKAPDGTESRLLNHPVANRVRRASTDLQFATAVAAFGMLLRDSEYRGTTDADLVLRNARAGIGNDRQGHRAGFVRMVEEFQRTSQVARVE